MNNNTGKSQSKENVDTRTRKRSGSSSLSLSTCHTAPDKNEQLRKWWSRRKGTVIIYENGGMIKVNKPKPLLKPKRHFEHDTRGRIRTFTKSSRRRLMRLLAKMTQIILPVFVTLTFPDDYPHKMTECKRLQDILGKRFKRYFPGASAIIRTEPQKRGAPHYHLLVWGVSYFDASWWFPHNWCEVVNSPDPNHFLWHIGECGNGNKHCVSKVNSWRGVWHYVSKYMAKTQNFPDLPELWNYPGRFWTVWNKEKLPWASVKSISLTYHEVVRLMRYMRRFMKMRGRDLPGLSMLCNANAWLERLPRLIE